MSNEPVVKLSKTVYVFDEIKRKFIEPVEAQPCAVEEGKFLAPEYSTDVQPPVTGTNEAAVCSADKLNWTVVPDFEGKTVYDVNGNTQVITEFGVAPPAGFTVDKPQALLDKEALAAAVTDRIDYIESQYQIAYQANIDYMGATFQADKASQTLITESLSAMNGTASSDFGWYDIANNKIPMTAGQLQGLSTSIFLRAQPMFYYRQDCKKAIRNATTVDDVNKVVWQYQPN